MSEAGEGRFDDNRRNVNPIQTVGGKTFLLQGDIWTDSSFEPDNMETTEITFLSDEYFDLLTEFPAAGEYFALGEQVIVVLDGIAYEIVLEATDSICISRTKSLTHSTVLILWSGLFVFAVSYTNQPIRRMHTCRANTTTNWKSGCGLSTNMGVPSPKWIMSCSVA
ncbi:MAG: hypothetical protein ACPG7F_08175 [Aggregatilineales bacterium]